MHTHTHIHILSDRRTPKHTNTQTLCLRFCDECWPHSGMVRCGIDSFICSNHSNRLFVFLPRFFLESVFFRLSICVLIIMIKAVIIAHIKLCFSVMLTLRDQTIKSIGRLLNDARHRRRCRSNYVTTLRQQNK